MIATLITLILVQAAPVRSELECALVSPAGDLFMFDASVGDAQATLAPRPKSSWPTAVVAGNRALDLKPSKFASQAFALDAAKDGLLFHLGSAGNSKAQAATIYRRAGKRAALPLAFGFCEKAEKALPASIVASARVLTAIDSAAPLFDPRRWTDACGLVLRDRRTANFDFTLKGPRQVEIASTTADVLPQPRMTLTRLARGNTDQMSVATFGGKAQPAGVDMFYSELNPAQAVRLIVLDGLDASSPKGAIGGYAICGYDKIERRSAAA